MHAFPWLGHHWYSGRNLNPKEKYEIYHPMTGQKATYYTELFDKDEQLMTYGYKGEGWKSGNYYTKYISKNPKFYTMD